MEMHGSSPRVRGTPAPRDEHACYGSSPRVRGTLARERKRSRRFIPACAGNSTAMTGPGASVRDGSSPRVRGTRYGRDLRSTALAVHPRVRGEHVDAHRNGRDLRRFIPACAGNSSTARRSPSFLTPVHPRVRGEQHCPGIVAPLCRRFIPACAGNATAMPLALGARAVHPRVCGEQPGRSPSDGWRPVRFIPAYAGNTATPLSLVSACRFIPAYAGNADCREIRPASTPVHPRVRGERRLSVTRE